jgi:hypothetical protein
LCCCCRHRGILQQLPQRLVVLNAIIQLRVWICCRTSNQSGCWEPEAEQVTCDQAYRACRKTSVFNW